MIVMRRLVFLGAAALGLVAVNAANASVAAAALNHCLPAASAPSAGEVIA